MRDEITLTLNSPITEEQWDHITDVDFEHTSEIVFHTKHGKEVVFVKEQKSKWIRLTTIKHQCSECKIVMAFFEGKTLKPTDYHYCPNCGAKLTEVVDEVDWILEEERQKRCEK